MIVMTRTGNIAFFIRFDRLVSTQLLDHTINSSLRLKLGLVSSRAREPSKWDFGIIICTRIRL